MRKCLGYGFLPRHCARMKGSHAVLAIRKWAFEHVCDPVEFGEQLSLRRSTPSDRRVQRNSCSGRRWNSAWSEDQLNRLRRIRDPRRPVVQKSSQFNVGLNRPSKRREPVTQPSDDGLSPFSQRSIIDKN